MNSAPHREPRHKTYTTGSRKIMISSGSEGPTHDPYSYTEYEVERASDLVTLVLHQGLGSWLEYQEPGRNPLRLVNLDEGEQVQVFERHLGCSLKHFEKACERARSICPKCGGRPHKQVDGHPGETFTLCRNGHVMDEDFDINAVI